VKLRRSKPVQDSWSDLALLAAEYRGVVAARNLGDQRWELFITDLAALTGRGKLPVGLVATELGISREALYAALRRYRLREQT
jgi:hypothetical protein